ncbi:olfactory receptor 5G9-like [Rhinoderma darwinii]|uniref:olfactory receptor 5G9-like n=1 Tax=Rhinoderma darwinii TaxID=43563 RepID=UPI003F67B27F
MSLMDSCEMKKYIGVWRFLLVDTRENNVTDVVEFVLLGFQGDPQLRIVLFCLLFVLFCLTICGNLLIITLVSISKNLHTPMYFFLTQLSINDILLPLNIVPNMLHILLNNRGAITFIGCMTQFLFFASFEMFECLLLTVMSYDRYVAICNPLRYTSIMTSGYCVRLAAISWIVGFFSSFSVNLTILRLKFCGHNIIDHLFCDFLPLREISCSDTFPLKLQMYLLSIPLLIIPVTLIVICYVNIVRAILRIPSNISRQKAFSTCSSHLTVVFIYFLTLFSVYVLPTRGQTSDMNKITSLLYTVFTPLFNPIIYSLRNKDIKKAVQANIQKYVSSIIPSVSGRKKTFSTCSSHLAVVSLYYGSLIIIYLFPNMHDAKKLLSLFYNVVTPLLNPMIYSLRNKDIKEALEKILQQMNN